MSLQRGEAALYQHIGYIIVIYRAMKYRAAGRQKVVYAPITAPVPEMDHTNKRDKDGNIIQKSTCIKANNHII